MLRRFDQALLKVNRWMVIVALAAMALMVFANVLLRFFTDNSILWVEEVSRYLMIWLTFLGSGIVLRYGGHIGIDTLQQRMPYHAPLIRAGIFFLLFLFFAVIGGVGAGHSWLTWGQNTPVMQNPPGAAF